MERILYESHMHTPLCKHARGNPTDYAAMAWERGLKGIVVTCHNPPVDGWSPHVRMADTQFDDYVELIDQARQEWAGRIDVRMGLECDFVPGMERAIEAQLARGDFHHVLAGVHPQLRDYKARFDTGDPVAFQHTYFEHLALAAESGLFDTIAHPDLVKNEDPDAWDLPRLRERISDTLDRIAAAGVAMELNTSGLQKRIPEMNPTRAILEEMLARGIPVMLGADAHAPERVAADYVPALELLRDVGFREVNVTLDRRRRPVEIDAALASLDMSYV